MSSLYCLLVCNGSLFPSSGQQYTSLTNPNQRTPPMFISYCLSRSRQQCALDLRRPRREHRRLITFSAAPTVRLRDRGGFIAAVDLPHRSQIHLLIRVGGICLEFCSDVYINCNSHFFITIVFLLRRSRYFLLMTKDIKRFKIRATCRSDIRLVQVTGLFRIH